MNWALPLARLFLQVLTLLRAFQPILNAYYVYQNDNVQLSVIDLHKYVTL